MAKCHENPEDQVSGRVSPDEYLCAQCNGYLDDHPWVGESGRQYCQESCVERAGDGVWEGRVQ